MKIIEAFLTPNQYSRSTIPIDPRGFVIHWPENAGQYAMGVRNWWESLKTGIKIGDDFIYGSAHAVIDFDGTIYQTIPWTEEAYHAGDNYPWFAHEAIRLFGSNPNRTTIGIELCHNDWSGKPTSDTLNAAIELCTYLCNEFDMDPLTDGWLHSLITGKGLPWGIKATAPCHKWFYNNMDEWAAFKASVASGLQSSEYIREE
jgi:N-acetylmuramoyl-L-alanine amidase CwlA